MSTVKYQIFISSTYNDLKEERDQVIKAVLEMGHIPVGMEMFSAADEEQWKLIARQIDQSDYYVVIVAYRYGSLAGKISYTEKEYDYAIQKGVPVIGFVINDSVPWPPDQVEDNLKKVELLKKFKTKVKKKPVGFWSNKEELYGRVPIALMKLFGTNPRPGWVRASELVGPEVLTEMSRLSSENSELRKKVETMQQFDTSNFAQGDEWAGLTIVCKDQNTTDEMRIELPYSWDELFLLIARSILDNPDEEYIGRRLNYSIETDLKSGWRNAGITPYRVSMLEGNQFNMIKTQLIGLRLIEIQFVTNPNTTNNWASSLLTHWNLTPLGIQKLAELTAIRRELPQSTT